MKVVSRYLNINSSQTFIFFLLIIFSLNTYLIYTIQLDAIDQITSLLLSFGIYIYFKEQKISDKSNNHLSQFLISLVILIFTLYRSLWIFVPGDKFIYCILPLLLISLNLNFFSYRNIFLQYKPLIISLLFALKQIIYIPLSITLTPISTFFTWFFLNILGYRAVVRGAEVFFDEGGINITFSCSGSDQIIFCVSAILVLSICFPLKNKILLLKQLLFTICFTLLVNIFRLSILTIFVRTADSDGFSIFDYMHGGNGSLVFSLISMILCCESYKRAYFKI